MSHLHPQTAIFSPSVARAAASTAKDWSYVDNWLKTRCAGVRTVPKFERNPDTLRALLALASHNEAVDEERHQLAQLEKAALDEVKAADAAKDAARQAQQQGTVKGELVADDILDAIEENLTREGRTALDAMARMAVELGMAFPTSETLGARYVELQAKVFELEQTLDRVALLQKYLDRESRTMDGFIQDARGPEYRPAADLAKQNLDLQRQIKTMSAKLPEIGQQLAALEKSVAIPNLTVEHVKKDEDAYLDLLATKKELDAQAKAFAGLPPDVEAARVELEALRAQLRDATARRDAIFEGLVERESPVKTRRRP
ncbi:hypothetical protein PG999_004173 [Apiospora kogelbergensis]|uniref:Phage shock protein A (PspA) family protein n=1 Tax=Apiospora kogelbergensis TaxID=1337665 RepID=A0AAW0QYK8_9PEZI